MSLLWCKETEDPGLQICCSKGGTARPAEEDHGKKMEATSIRGPANYGGQQKAMLMRNEGASESFVAMLGSQASLQVPHSGHGDGVAAGVCGQKRPYYGASSTQDGPTVEEAEDGDEGIGDDCSPHVEKKRRLTFDQVRSLERNFEVENKLEPERKMQLAKELGLQPRQVAVWFQNRRARWKTKQLERDYEVLTVDYERLKADLEVVQREKEELKAEVERLQMENHPSEKSEPTDSRDTKNLSNEKSSCEPTAPCSVKLESDCRDREDPSSPARLQIQQQANSRSPPTIDVRDVKSSSSARVVEVKEELTTTSSDSNSSDILDADSPRTTDSTSSLSTSVQAETLNPKALGQSSSCPQFPPESFASPCNLLPSICEEDMSTAGQAGVSSRPAGIVKLEDGSTGFHDDHSCNYLLPQLDEQCILPWWDWS